MRNKNFDADLLKTLNEQPMRSKTKKQPMRLSETTSVGIFITFVCC